MRWQASVLPLSQENEAPVSNWDSRTNDRLYLDNAMTEYHAPLRFPILSEGKGCYSDASSPRPRSSTHVRRQGRFLLVDMTTIRYLALPLSFWDVQPPIHWPASYCRRSLRLLVSSQWSMPAWIWAADPQLTIFSPGASVGWLSNCTPNGHTGCPASAF
jgi:hypothetical protein